MLLTYEQEIILVKKILLALGAREDEAEATARVLSEGDVRGFSSHGLLRLPYVVRGIRRGTIRLNVRPKVVQERVAIAILDGDYGLGHFVASEAMKLAIMKARQAGIGAVGVYRSNHFGIAGYYAEMAMENGMIGVVMATTDPLVHPVGGVEPVLGTNALAIGIPNKRYPVLLDMATSMAARGKLVAAMKSGKPIPQDWAIGPEGFPTTDPSKALAGALSPFGGTKGYGLGFIIGILAGPLVMAEAGRKVQGTLEPKSFSTKGDFMMAIDPCAFTAEDEFERKVAEFVEDVKASKKAPGFSEILVPGEPEYRTRERTLRNGVEIADAVWQEIDEICRDLGIKLEGLGLSR